MAIGLDIPNVVLSFRRRRNLFNIIMRFLLRRNDKLRIFLLILIPFLSILNLSAQNHITLEKWGTAKHRRFYTNDYLWYKTKDTNIWKGGRIDTIFEKSIVVEGEEVPISKIIKVKAERTSLNYVADGIMLMIAGTGYAVIVLANGLLNNDRPIYSNNNIGISAGLVVGGYLLTTLRMRNYSIGDKWHLKISIDERNQAPIYQKK